VNNHALIPLVLSQAFRPGRFTALPVIFSILGFIGFVYYFDSRTESIDPLKIYMLIWSCTAAVFVQLIGFFMVHRFAELKSVLENDRKELILARTVHESLFPAFQGNNKIQFYTFRSPENELGGDFYDLVFLREGNVGLFLSDISGHGISAAMLSAAMKVILNKLPYRCRIDPEEMLTRFDQIISENYNNHHATAVYILFDFIKMECTLANAGHPPVLFSRNYEPFQEIESSGSLLGYNFRSPAADSIQMSLKKGDRFLFYTDGLVEYETIEGTVNAFEISEISENINNFTGEEVIETIIKRVRNRNDFLRFRDDVLIVMAEIQ
jgi:serine phosphatase RsbU (regulator of sigma subunit)